MCISSILPAFRGRSWPGAPTGRRTTSGRTQRPAHRSRLIYYNFSQAFTLGGGGGIRTPEGFYTLTVFKTAAIDHSATPPATDFGRAGGTRPPNRRFWRPLLYQLSYRPTRF